MAGIASFTRKRGRPRKNAAADKPAAQADRGSDLARTKRAMALGFAPYTDVKTRKLVTGGDLSLAAFPLSVLLARGAIDESQHEAGWYYAYLYGRTIGRTTPKAYKLDGMVATAGALFGFDEDRQEKLEALFAKGRTALMDAGRTARIEVENLVVFHQWPEFLDDSTRPSAFNQWRRITGGLDALGRVYGKVLDRDAPRKGAGRRRA